jgi:hypothetical protein
MGYGHLRAGHTLAEGLGTDLLRLDQPPLSNALSAFLWRAALWLFKALSRAGDWLVIGPAASLCLRHITKMSFPPQPGLLEAPGV